MGIEKITADQYEEIITRASQLGYIRSSAAAVVDIVLSEVGIEVQPPAPKVRPYKDAAEAVVLIGRDVRSVRYNETYRVKYVEGDHVCFDNAQGLDWFANLAKYYITVDDQKPCGVIEPAT